MSHNLRLVTRECKHGTFSFSPDDEYVGKSLDKYGEYSEEEVTMAQMILSPGDVVIEVGANIGALTVPMAKMLKPGGRLIAFEPHPVNCSILRSNIRQNDLEDIVDVRSEAVGEHPAVMQMPAFDELKGKNFGQIVLGEGRLQTPVTTLDVACIDIEKVRLIKLDCEGMEADVLRGAKNLIARSCENKCKPILYVENDRHEKSPELIATIVDLGYRCFWHRPPLFTPLNYNLNQDNAFGEIVSINLLCHKEEISAIIDGFDEATDLRFGPDIYTREIARFERISKMHPNDLRAKLILAHNHHLMQHVDESNRLLEEILAVNPNDWAALAIQGLYKLQRGDWSGWQGYEYRYKQRNTKPFGDRPRKGEKWDGQPTDEPVLIWNEQGYGDSIMFGRFLKEAFRRAPNAFVEMHFPLHELYELSGLIPQGHLIRMGRKLPDYKKHCSIPSLPAVLGVKSDEEVWSPPYIKADEQMIENWAKQKPPKIGICCVGSRYSERPYTRDIDHNLFKPLTEKYGPWMSLVQEECKFESFADTASLIACLDLVISVDTSVAHLAAAMGKETWLLLSIDPDWRYGLTGSTTIWYDSMRIFRQKKLLDWQGVVDEVAIALEERYGSEKDRRVA